VRFDVVDAWHPLQRSAGSPVLVGQHIPMQGHHSAVNLDLHRVRVTYLPAQGFPGSLTQDDIVGVPTGEVVSSVRRDSATAVGQVA